MGWFSRLVHRVQEWFSEPETPRERPRGDITGGDFPEPLAPPPPDLPPGWKFEGLYYGDRAPDARKVINKDPSDHDIATADDIIVSYTDALGTTYKTVHGANSRADVGKLIQRTIMVVSPPR